MYSDKLRTNITKNLHLLSNTIIIDLNQRIEQSKRLHIHALNQ